MRYLMWQEKNMRRHLFYNIDSTLGHNYVKLSLLYWSFIGHFYWLKLQDYGEQATSDNIADTMGLQAIFKAYESKKKQSKTPDAILPGMKDFATNQLFFLSFANVSVTLREL